MCCLLSEALYQPTKSLTPLVSLTPLLLLFHNNHHHLHLFQHHYLRRNLPPLPRLFFKYDFFAELLPELELDISCRCECECGRSCGVDCECECACDATNLLSTIVFSCSSTSCSSSFSIFVDNCSFVLTLCTNSRGAKVASSQLKGASRGRY